MPPVFHWWCLLWLLTKKIKKIHSSSSTFFSAKNESSFLQLIIALYDTVDVFMRTSTTPFLQTPIVEKTKLSIYINIPNS